MSSLSVAKFALLVSAASAEKCSVGAPVQCNSLADLHVAAVVMCEGRQCCPGIAASGGKTYLCPSADKSQEGVMDVCDYEQEYKKPFADCTKSNEHPVDDQCYVPDVPNAYINSKAPIDTEFPYEAGAKLEWKCEAGWSFKGKKEVTAVTAKCTIGMFVPETDGISYESFMAGCSPAGHDYTCPNYSNVDCGPCTTQAAAIGACTQCEGTQCCPGRDETNGKSYLCPSHPAVNDDQNPCDTTQRHFKCADDNLKVVLV